MNSKTQSDRLRELLDERGTYYETEERGEYRGICKTENTWWGTPTDPRTGERLSSFPSHKFNYRAEELYGKLALRVKNIPHSIATEAILRFRDHTFDPGDDGATMVACLLDAEEVIAITDWFEERRQDV